MGRTSSPSLSRLARWSTELLSPFLLVVALVTWVAWLTDPAWLRTALVAVAFFSLIPLALSLVMTRMGAVTDKYIRHRTQRHMFYGLSLVSMLTGAGAIMVMDTSAESRWMVSIAVATLLVVMLINTRLKISIHALIAALAAVVFPAGLFHPVLVFGVISVWALASWSRVYLSRHTVLEVIFGSVLGVIVGSVFLVAVGGLPSPS